MKPLAALTKFGLSDKEARAYLALLELEVATAHEVASKAELNRSSAYVVLESLREKGLASVSVGETTKQYVASSPDMLVERAADAAEKQAKIERSINDLLPDLKSLHRDTKQKPRVRILEGKAGLIQSFEETLRVRDKVMRVVSSADDIQRSLPDYLPKYVQRRTELGIAMYGIHPFSEQGDYIRKHYAPLDQIKLIPPERWAFNSDFAIFDDTVGFMLHKDLVAIHIENAAIADAMKKVFDLAFEEATRLDINTTKSNPTLKKR
ncbi:MAG: helix-turn-helix domain-containing protein [Patescibacteria group bacterium]